jgi:NAD(P)-dependent dehydrogenase (short-subunit alcohol dehydrogenase family)
MKGRVCLITGASDGIGKETARGLAALGASVIMVGRGPEKTERAAEDVRADTGGEVQTITANFSSLAEVRALARRVGERWPALHMLVNNAGLWHRTRTLSADGYEDTLAVNHLAPFLLTTLLLPVLRSGKARVVTVASRLHERETRFAFDDPFFETRRYGGMAAYRQSKLANVMFANELAHRTEGTGVTSNSVHPGNVATSIVRESSFLQWGLSRVARFFVLTPAEGARTSIHVASSPAVEGMTGRYFKKCRPAEPSRVALDRAACERLWELSEKLVADR